MTSLGLVMICKDEVAGIEATLASLRPHISHWTVLDTGSTDGTQDIVQAALDGIPGALYEEPFIDFGTTRSRAFELARGTAEFLVATDADMTWTIDPDWYQDADALMVRMGSPEFEWRLPLVLRGDLPWRSEGVMHEYTVLADGSLGSRANTDAFQVTYPDRSSPEKTAWQAQLLLAEMERDPSNPRTVFYTAQSLAECGDKDEARKLYQRRAEMGGWPEEAFYSRYMAATLEPDPPTKLAALLDAWETRPQRLEPLYDAVRLLNRSDAHHAAYLLSGGVLAPCGDALFLHKWVWSWGMTFERSVAAWYVDRAEFERLTAELLAMELPGHIRAAVERNAAA